MQFREILTLAAMPLAAIFLVSTATAQGGWRQWEIHLRDGSVVEANPLGINEKGKFTRSMDTNELGIDRSQIAYIAPARSELPPLPSDKVKKDIVVLLDGSKVVGTVRILEIKFSEGSYIQNGRRGSLQNVAYILFKRAKKY